MKNLVVFLTHNCKKLFVKTVNSLDVKQCDVLILIDDSQYKSDLDDFSDINSCVMLETVSKNQRMSYDILGGHTMYINYFRKNMYLLSKYDYIYVFENDVYYHGKLQSFINAHSDVSYHADLLVPEFGLRDKNWMWFNRRFVFKPSTVPKNIGCKAYALRFSTEFLRWFLNQLGDQFNGYVEAILPRVCADYHWKLNRFIDTHIGVTAISTDNKLIKAVTKDLLNNTNHVLENKLYHPIKL
tara:strand:+ start:697 stop:1419 length:723 start_codon:yes stop_codon:yes gene_type:complete